MDHFARFDIFLVKVQVLHVENNKKSIEVTVRREKLRVLYVEGSPRWEYRKLKDLNVTDYGQGTVIKAVAFHPTATLNLVAGLNGTATLFHVDGKTNPKMQSVNFKVGFGSLQTSYANS